MIANYKLNEKLYESSRTVVFRGLRESDGLPIIFKMLKNEYPSSEEVARLRREFETASDIYFEGIARPYSIEKNKSTFFMVLEDFGGFSVDKVLASKKVLGISTFLHLAIQLANILGEIHHRGVIHKNISPSNIVWNSDNNEVKLIDFGISAQLSWKNPDVQGTKVVEGSFAYISPEQTGRMNRVIDYRTDYYSLGVTFYELLIGYVPFQYTDPMELVHCHLAKEAEAPHEINHEIPKVVSDIIMKLMSKMAEGRYQSTYGLMADLQRVQEQLRSTANIYDFPIGQKDISEQFRISQNLYGREKEMEVLMKVFGEVSKGSKEIVLVAGYAGVGKSSLVNEIQRLIAARNGYFISGKFDQFRRNVPYYSLIQAFQGLVSQILLESEEKITLWQEMLRKALGPNGQVITMVIPEMELIIGRQSDIPKLGPTESQNRFMGVCT